jgi:hypothetical protein
MRNQMFHERTQHLGHVEGISEADPRSAVAGVAASFDRSSGPVLVRDCGITWIQLK